MIGTRCRRASTSNQTPASSRTSVCARASRGASAGGSERSTAIAGVSSGTRAIPLHGQQHVPELKAAALGHDAEDLMSRFQRGMTKQLLEQQIDRRGPDVARRAQVREPALARQLDAAADGEIVRLVEKAVRRIVRDEPVERAR